MSDARNRGLALLAGIVVAGVGWLVAVAIPTSRVADDHRAAIVEADDRAVVLRRQANRLEEIDPEPVDAALEALRAAIPPTAELPRLISTIQRQADDAGVRLTALTPANTTSVVTGPDDTTSALAVATSTLGPYAAQLAYVANLQRADRLIVIDALSFLADPSDPSRLALELSMRAFTEEDLGVSDDAAARVAAATEPVG